MWLFHFHGLSIVYLITVSQKSPATQTWVKKGNFIAWFHWNWLQIWRPFQIFTIEDLQEFKYTFFLVMNLSVRKLQSFVSELPKYNNGDFCPGTKGDLGKNWNSFLVNWKVYRRENEIIWTLTRLNPNVSWTESAATNYIIIYVSCFILDHFDDYIVSC